jgi:hypothetical protein
MGQCVRLLESGKWSSRSRSMSRCEFCSIDRPTYTPTFIRSSLMGLGESRAPAAVLVGGRHVRLLEGLYTELNEGDDITLLVPFGGG